ncbi:MAG: V-type ATP synthase subunit D [Candidatus Micrarchaeia archaeon]
MRRPNPTRMNLINLKRNIVLARKGHDILKRKREVLVLEFLRLLQESKSDRDYLQSLIQESYKTVAIASTYVGSFQLETIAAHVTETSPVSIVLKNIMGVKVPEIKRAGSKEFIGLLSRGYSLITTSTAVDDVSDSFQSVEENILEIAKREQGLKRIVIEIDKTKRRVNALEYILVPSLNAQVKYITMRLDEMDRDMFSALKHVKKKLAKVEVSA